MKDLETIKRIKMSTMTTATLAKFVSNWLESGLVDRRSSIVIMCESPVAIPRIKNKKNDFTFLSIATSKKVKSRLPRKPITVDNKTENIFAKSKLKPRLANKLKAKKSMHVATIPTPTNFAKRLNKPPLTFDF